MKIWLTRDAEAGENWLTICMWGEEAIWCEDRQTWDGIDDNRLIEINCTNFSMMFNFLQEPGTMLSANIKFGEEVKHGK